MRAWTCGFVMAIGLVVNPDTAPAQMQAGEPAEKEIGHVRSHHQALRTMITTASEQSFPPSGGNDQRERWHRLY